MARDHRYTLDEMQAATGLEVERIRAVLKQIGIEADVARRTAAPPGVRLLPYPGGRHPRLGFLEGAIEPQRETKASVFTPWESGSYVVLDVPEAIWSNLGLTYLAHRHVPTIWEEQGVQLPRLEWQRPAAGRLQLTRRLPNGIVFATRLQLSGQTVVMQMSLTNGTRETLRDLRVQNCVMLGYCRGFEQQTNDNKLFRPPYAACGNRQRNRWVIVAWRPNHRTWGNARCPCLHSDPVFPDCPPGQTRQVEGRLWFYEGPHIDAELQRLAAEGCDEPD